MSFQPQLVWRLRFPVLFGARRIDRGGRYFCMSVDPCFARPYRVRCNMGDVGAAFGRPMGSVRFRGAGNDRRSLRGRAQLAPTGYLSMVHCRDTFGRPHGKSTDNGLGNDGRAQLAPTGCGVTREPRGPLADHRRAQSTPLQGSAEIMGAAYGRPHVILVIPGCIPAPGPLSRRHSRLRGPEGRCRWIP